jgi:hypothetical protein
MDVTRQCPRLLQRREVAADRHLGPSGYVEHTLYPLARRVHNFLGKLRIGKRGAESLARAEPKRLTGVLFVHAKRRCDVAREPIDRDVRQQLIKVKPLSEFVVAVTPGEKLFEQPRCKSGRGIGQRVCQGLRFCGLDVAVAAFSFDPSSPSRKPRRLCRRKRTIGLRSARTASRDIVEYWRDRFDWRAAERRLNGSSQFTTEIDGHIVHYVHVKGVDPESAPLVLTHGWPGSFVEMYKIIPMLNDPANNGLPGFRSFDVIVPSLPGFGFSPAPVSPGTSSRAVASLWHMLMAELGHSSYFAQGGDIGSGVSTWLARLYPHRPSKMTGSSLLPTMPAMLCLSPL